MTDLLLAGWLLYVGIIPFSTYTINDTTRQYTNSVIEHVRLDFYATEYAHIYTTIEVRETKAYEVYFDPYRADFRIGGELRYKNFAMGFWHECNHDIVTNILLNPYNGWDAAFADLYLSWQKPLEVTPSVTLTPLLFAAYQPYNSILLKFQDGEKYLGNIHGPPSNPNDPYFNRYEDYVVMNHNLIARIGLEAELFGFLYTSLAFQPELSAAYMEWACFNLDFSLELRRRGIALGLSFNNRFDAGVNTGYAAHELRLYAAFRGKAVLF
ncbi:MAG: hypothetical protein LBC88_00290 [Spirochaetaceae bacterium]|jgi:hypothetical protein|nr:hypothetical protein [Spirochaetaceae bacterium]